MKLLTDDVLDLAEILETAGIDENTIMELIMPKVADKKGKSEKQIEEEQSELQVKAMIKIFKKLSKSREKVKELLSKITGKDKDKIDIIELVNEMREAGGLTSFLSQAQQSQKSE